ncbi:MAG: hypothetical protein AAB553_04390 [Patescibacteria group bacterium]
MTPHQLYLGYWYQRTSLHLSEVYDFLRDGTSPLALDKTKLKQLQQDLTLKTVTYKLDVLESLVIETTSGIAITFFEDGLVVMKLSFHELGEAKEKLSDYYEKKFAPAIQYLFSLGAPVPKELAKVQPIYPYFLVTKKASRETVDKLLKELGEEEYFELQDKAVAIYRGDTHFVLNEEESFEQIESLIGMLIFFSEFKAQLHRYLNLHRIIWEKIERIKEQGSISGRDIERQRQELEGYKKTIELIDGRIEQMGLYISTRATIVKESGWEKVLTKILAFRYENLQHTLDYVKSLWKMTKQYVDAGIQIFNELNQTSTKNAVTALTIISSVGIVGVILAHLEKIAYPNISFVGFFYLVLLLAIAFLINRLVQYIFQSMRYKITEDDFKKTLD